MTQNGASKFLVKWWIFLLFMAMIWNFGLILPYRTSPEVTQSHFGHRKLTSKSLNRYKQKFGWSIFSCTLNPTDGSTWGKTGNGFVYFITYCQNQMFPWVVGGLIFIKNVPFMQISQKITFTKLTWKLPNTIINFLVVSSAP